MFKKSFVLILILSFVLMMASFAFVQNDDDENIEYVKIINPKVAQSGKFISESSLFISILVLEDVDLELALYKIESPVYEFDEMYVEEDLQLDIELKSITNFDDDKSVDISEPLETSYREITDLTRDNIINHYLKSESELASIKVLYFEVLSEIKLFANLERELNINQEISDSEFELFKVEAEYSSRLINAKNEFQYWKNKYDSLFEIVIINNIDIEVDILLPYFEYIVEDVAKGKYKLVITKKSDNEIVESLEFQIVTEESILKEIENNIDETTELLNEIIKEVIIKQ